MAHFFYSTHPTFHHAEKTITLHTKDEAAIPLADFIKPLVPDYHGNPLLFNGHLQTAWTVNKYFGDPFVIHYARNNHINPRDGGHFAIDVVIPEFDESLSPEDLPERTRHMPESEEAAFASDDTRPMLIALHGLSGGSHEVYLRAVLHALLTGPGGDKWEACVVNARGCAQSRISTKQLFNARWTSDIRETVEYLHRVFPNRPLFAIGFSLGANILTNYLGEQGEDCVLKAAIICSNPWQLELSSKAMHRSWIGREIYSKTMTTNLKRLVEQHLYELGDDPRIDLEALRKATYVYEFDRDLTSKVFGYPTVGAYYRDASSVDNLLKNRVPMLVIHAKDDPISVEEVIPYDEVRANPYVFLITTEGGGHLSWFEFGGGRWFAKPICSFLTKFADEVINVVDHLEGDELLYGNATGAQLGWKTKGLSNGPTPTDSASGSVSGSRSPDGLETGLANGFADGLADGLANGLANETKDPELKKTE